MARPIPFAVAEDRLHAAATQIFQSDQRARSVGIARYGSGFGYHVVRNSLQVAAQGAVKTLAAVEEIPVCYTDVPGNPESLVLTQGLGIAKRVATSLIPEVQRHRSLACGLQIQNFDDDTRSDRLPDGRVCVGTLGGFVEREAGSPAILSNNHMLAGQNSGVVGADRILQPGSLVYDPSEQVAILADFVPLMMSPPDATFEEGSAHLNEIDAGVATLDPRVGFQQSFLEFRNLPSPSGFAQAKNGDRVFKVGRSTGLTWGEVTDVQTFVGPVSYDQGVCWFRGSLTIEGAEGTLFSDYGDSGSLVVRANGEVVGLLYAGNGRQTYACPIGRVLSALGVRLL